MKKVTITFLSFIFTLLTVHAQKDINSRIIYGAGGRLTMHIDSGANKVNYGLQFPNQPNTYFNLLMDVNHVSIQMYFKKTENPQNFRYTILIDDKPIVVNKSIDKENLKDVIRKDDDWKDVIRDSTSLGVFPIKGRIITILTYDIQRPQDVSKSVFYGKPFPRQKIEVLAKRFRKERGVGYNYIPEPNEKVDLTFTEKDDELTIVKERTDIDFLYSTSIKDKRTNKIVFESTSWLYGGYIDKAGKQSPYLRIDKSIFKKSGEYEIIIKPMVRWDQDLNGILDFAISPEEIAAYTASYTLAITIHQEGFTKKETLIYILIVTICLSLVFLIIFYFTRKRNQKILTEKEQQKNTAKLQLNSIRSQLNPHFLFNALSGIQNLMNKNDMYNANKYLSKFARLTRNVLDNKELISLSQEKKLLDDYLQMEQLRFGFSYEIKHSGDLDLDNIEIPSMLVQPFVENAVKHGISQKTTAGKISIEFFKQANNLVLTVNDNGFGFDIDKKNNGLGLRLSDSRIALLNNIYKENRFILAIQSTNKGTEIRLTLTDWL